MSKVKTRRATEADRKAALDALERANIPVIDVATELDTYPEKWTLKHCRAAILKAGMTDDDIDAVFAANDPTKDEGQSVAEDVPSPLESSPSDPGHPLHICRTCADWGGDGDLGSADCWDACTVGGSPRGEQDHWRPSQDHWCSTCIHEGKEDNEDTCSSCYEAFNEGKDWPNWQPVHPIFAQQSADTPPDAAPAPTELADAPENDAPADLLNNPHNVHKLGRETIEVEQELTKDERLEVAARMAKALADRDRLELEFAGVKKDYKAKIDLSVSEAAEAGAEFRAGKRKLSVRAVKLEDRTTMEIVFVEPDGAQRELMRRPMTHEERKLPLPLQQADQSAAAPTIGTTEPTPDNARTCITCANMVQGDAELPEPCQTCSQCGNGDADNWAPWKECATCTDSTTRVGLYPCNGCSLNADAEHRGDEDRWTWKDAAPELTADATDEQLASTDETEGMPTAEEDTPAQSVAHGEDNMPTGDGTAADDMPTMPTVQHAEDMPTVRQ